MDYRPPGSSVRELLLARILEWVAISFYRDRTLVSCIAGRYFTIWASVYMLISERQNIYIFKFLNINCHRTHCSYSLPQTPVFPSLSFQCFSRSLWTGMCRLELLESLSIPARLNLILSRKIFVCLNMISGPSHMKFLLCAFFPMYGSYLFALCIYLFFFFFLVIGNWTC